MQQHGRFLWVSGAAILMFRSELAILLGLILLMELVRGGVTLNRVIAHVIPAGLVLLGEQGRGISCRGGASHAGAGHLVQAWDDQVY